MGCLLGIIIISNLGIFALDTKTNTRVHSSLVAQKYLLLIKNFQTGELSKDQNRNFNSDELPKF